MCRASLCTFSRAARSPLNQICPPPSQHQTSSLSLPKTKILRLPLFKTTPFFLSRLIFPSLSPSPTPLPFSPRPTSPPPQDQLPPSLHPQAYRSINAPLRDRDRFAAGMPHPLPVTVALIRDALSKLRAVEADGAAGGTLDTARMASGASGHLRRVHLYRGIKDVCPPPDFMEKGGTELAPMSVGANSNTARSRPCRLREARLHSTRFSGARRPVLI
jgi:hypothetical protein